MQEQEQMGSDEKGICIVFRQFKCLPDKRNCPADLCPNDMVRQSFKLINEVTGSGTVQKEKVFLSADVNLKPVKVTYSHRNLISSVYLIWKRNENFPSGEFIVFLLCRK